MKLEEIERTLKKELPPQRFLHSQGVANTAVVMANQFGASEEKAYLAGILHDCAKGKTEGELLKLCEKYHVILAADDRMTPGVLHAYVGAHLAYKKYGVEQRDVLAAIYCHTVGWEHMSVLDKIIFVADMIEPGRDFPGVEEIRKAAKENLNQASILCCDSTIKHLIDTRRFINRRAIACRNNILMEERKLHEA